MSLFFQYLLKLSVSIALLYLFYALVLRRLTFYKCNRWYFIVHTVLAFLLPLFNVYSILQQTKLTESRIVTIIPEMVAMPAGHQVAIIATNSKMSAGSWFLLLFLSGALLLLVRLFIQYASYLRLRRKARLLRDGDVKVYDADTNGVPFSFGKAIFINRQRHTEEELLQIIRHELVHIQQRHSLDIIWSEIFCAVNWYNPFAWAMRKALRQNLEFIADDKVLQAGLDRKQYQYLLLKVMATPGFSLSSGFSFSSLKKRIIMMNKGKSASVHLIRFLFLAPVIVVALLAFRSSQQLPAPKQQRGSSSPIMGIRADSYSIDTIPSDKETQTIDVKNDHADFHKRNPNVKVVEWNRSIMFVTLKSGAEERYDLNEPAEKEAAEKKYGKLPTPPPPPPPYARGAVNQDEYNSFLKEHPDVKDISWSNKTNIVVKLKSGKEERYDVNNYTDIDALSAKYGQLPLAPALPPPPPPPPPLPPPPPPPLSPIPYNNGGETNSYKLNKIFLQQNRTVKVVNWDTDKVTLKLKSGKEEAYRLSDEKDRADFEKKYSAVLPAMFPPPSTAPKAPTSPRPPKPAMAPPSPPTPPVPSKEANNSAPTQPGSQVVRFETDTLRWNSKSNTASFTGTLFLEKEETKLTASLITITPPTALILINGKELDKSKDFSSTTKSAYIITNLDKAAAMQKYGSKGENGAVEIRTL